VSPNDDNAISTMVGCINVDDNQIFGKRAKGRQASLLAKQISVYKMW